MQPEGFFRCNMCFAHYHKNKRQPSCFFTSSTSLTVSFCLTAPAKAIDLFIQPDLSCCSSHVFCTFCAGWLEPAGSPGAAAAIAAAASASALACCSSLFSFSSSAACSAIAASFSASCCFRAKLSLSFTHSFCCWSCSRATMEKAAEGSSDVHGQKTCPGPGPRLSSASGALAHTVMPSQFPSSSGTTALLMKKLIHFTEYQR